MSRIKFSNMIGASTSGSRISNSEQHELYDDDDETASISTLGIGGASTTFSETRAASQAARADLERLLMQSNSNLEEIDEEEQHDRHEKEEEEEDSYIDTNRMNGVGSRSFYSERGSIMRGIGGVSSSDSNMYNNSSNFKQKSRDVDSISMESTVLKVKADSSGSHSSVTRKISPLDRGTASGKSRKNVRHNQYHGQSQAQPLRLDYALSSGSEQRQPRVSNSKSFGSRDVASNSDSRKIGQTSKGGSCSGTSSDESFSYLASYDTPTTSIPMKYKESSQMYDTTKRVDYESLSAAASLDSLDRKNKASALTLSKFDLEEDDDVSIKSTKSEETMLSVATNTTFHKELERFREKWNIGTPSSTDESSTHNNNNYNNNSIKKKTTFEDSTTFSKSSRGLHKIYEDEDSTTTATTAAKTMDASMTMKDDSNSTYHRPFLNVKSSFSSSMKEPVVQQRMYLSDSSTFSSQPQNNNRQLQQSNHTNELTLTESGSTLLEYGYDNHTNDPEFAYLDKKYGFSSGKPYTTTPKEDSPRKKQKQRKQSTRGNKYNYNDKLYHSDESESILSRNLSNLHRHGGNKPHRSRSQERAVVSSDSSYNSASVSSNRRLKQQHSSTSTSTSTSTSSQSSSNRSRKGENKRRGNTTRNQKSKSEVVIQEDDSIIITKSKEKDTTTNKSRTKKTNNSEDPQEDDYEKMQGLKIGLKKSQKSNQALESKLVTLQNQLKNMNTNDKQVKDDDSITMESFISSSTALDDDKNLKQRGSGGNRKSRDRKENSRFSFDDVGKDDSDSYSRLDSDTSFKQRHTNTNKKSKSKPKPKLSESVSTVSPTDLPNNATHGSSSIASTAIMDQGRTYDTSVPTHHHLPSDPFQKKLESLYEDKITNLDAKINELALLLNQRDEHIHTLQQDQLHTKEQYIQTNQKQLQSVSREMEEALIHEKDKIRDEYHIQMKEKQNMLQDMEYTIQTKDAKFQGVQTQLDQLNNCLESRLRSNKELHDTISSLEQKLRKKDQINSELHSELEIYKGDTKSRDTQLESYIKRCATIDQEISGKDDLITSLQKQMQTVQEELERHQVQTTNMTLVDTYEYENMQKQLNKAKRIIEEDEDKQNCTNGLDATRSHNALKEVVSVLKMRLRDTDQKLQHMDEFKLHMTSLEQENKLLIQQQTVYEKDKSENNNQVKNVVKEAHEQITNLKKQLVDAIHRKDYVEKKLQTNSKLLGQAESLMAATNQNTLNAIMDAISKSKPSGSGDEDGNGRDKKINDLPRLRT